MSKLRELADLGQAVWYDYIRRAFITSGELQELIQQGLRGVTSNPSIFEKAIVGSADYDDDLRKLVDDNKSVDEIYETLALEDISRAADLLRPVYDATDGLDGYVSLEVSPKLAHDTQGTIEEARRLFAALNKPNVMIKVPATSEGIPAITELIGDGINVNVTLLFSVDNYEKVANAYITGLERLQANGGKVADVASVASFFVSRVDTAVDEALEEVGNEALQGKIGIANSKAAYARFNRIFNDDRWQKLASAGARAQRLLWASTGVKNPKYPDTLYVDELIGPRTVNTMPPDTLTALLDHGTVKETLGTGLKDAQDQLSQLQELGIDLDAITKQLQKEGVDKFAKSFEKLMSGIEEKRDELVQEKMRLSASLGEFESKVDSALKELKENGVMQRIWDHDHTVWSPDPTEISNRLGWLHSPVKMEENIQQIETFVEDVRAAGFTHALLLGMGGSSLAPELFRHVFGVRKGYLDLAVLDSTDPEAVLSYAESLDLSKTLFIVSTKSGGTVETLSFFKYFFNLVSEEVGESKAAEHFVAITDPESGLEKTAKELSFRKIFLNDPNIGGRYSALSYFGLVPAALIGVDLQTLLDRAATMACNCEGCNCPVEGDNSGAWLGAVLGEMASAGHDKITLVASPEIAHFGAWAEQLIAESTGKQGKGILPVDGENLGSPDQYADDRFFAYLRLESDATHDAKIDALREAGHPVVQLDLRDPYDLGGELFRWEMATAIAGRTLGINPFDQPNVESAKVSAREMVTAYQQKGALPEPTATWRSDDMAVFYHQHIEDLKDAFDKFFANIKTEPPRSYVAVQAYLPPTPETDRALQAIRLPIRDKFKVATTVGYGPRFLHSTGQLHKGDAGNGLFIQITSQPQRDADIPDEAGAAESSITFGVLKLAQALGDRKALLDEGRVVLRVHFSGESEAALQQLQSVLAEI